MTGKNTIIGGRGDQRPRRANHVSAYYIRTADRDSASHSKTGSRGLAARGRSSSCGLSSRPGSNNIVSDIFHGILILSNENAGRGLMIGVGFSRKTQLLSLCCLKGMAMLVNTGCWIHIDKTYPSMRRGRTERLFPKNFARFAGVDHVAFQGVLSSASCSKPAGAAVPEGAAG